MKKETIYIFKIQDKEVERVNWDIATNDIEIIKSCLAASQGVNFDDIDMEMIDVYTPELSLEAWVNQSGLVFRPNRAYAMPRIVYGLGSIQRLDTEEGFETFLGFISRKDIDNAITFY